MKILLTTLNSKYIHSNLALRYLYSVMAKSNLDISMREFTINNDRDYVYTEIVRGGYEMVCFSCYIWNIEHIKELCQNLKKARPYIKIMLGGPEVSYESETFMKENFWADYIIRGEGEYPFFQFCKELFLENADLSKVPSLVYRTKDKIKVNEDGPVPKMDQIPFPYEQLPIEDDKVIYYESSRGCPYKCSYCLSSLDKSIRSLSMERIRRDLGYFLGRGVKQVKFIDRTFNYNKARAMEIWNYLIANDNEVTNFHFEICGELLDYECLRLLSKARKGLFQFEIGIQSTNSGALELVNRKDDFQRISENVRNLMTLGNIHVHVDLIAGLPGEDYMSFAHSFNQVYELGADNLQLGFLKLLKGTPIRNEASKYGYTYRDKAPYEVISNDYMLAVDLVKLKMIENVLDLFSNKGGFENTLDYLSRKFAKTPFNFFEQLADFFYGKGFQNRSHKKEDLYRILAKFAGEKEYKIPGITKWTQGILEQDMENTLNFDAIKKFKKKGWDI